MIHWQYGIIHRDRGADLCDLADFAMHVERGKPLRVYREQRCAVTSFGVLHVMVWEDRETEMIGGYYAGCLVGVSIGDTVPEYPTWEIDHVNARIEDALPEALARARAWLLSTSQRIADESETVRPRGTP